jgi:hypothetical protein
VCSPRQRLQKHVPAAEASGSRSLVAASSAPTVLRGEWGSLSLARHRARFRFARATVRGGACEPPALSGFGARREILPRCASSHPCRLRRVVSTCRAPSAEIFAEAFCREARVNSIGFGTEVLPQARRPRSNEFRVGSSIVGIPRRLKIVKMPRRRPTHSRSRREAGFLARRPSRLRYRKTDGVTPLARLPPKKPG